MTNSDGIDFWALCDQLREETRRRDPSCDGPEYTRYCLSVARYYEPAWRRFLQSYITPVLWAISDYTLPGLAAIGAWWRNETNGR